MQVRAVIFCPWGRYERQYRSAAADARMTVYVADSVQEFASQLVRDVDAVGLLWSMGAVSAATIVGKLRLEDVSNKIIVLLDDSRAASRSWFAPDYARILMAGADDAQQADIDGRELAARMGAVMRRGQYVDHLRIEFVDCAYTHNTNTVESPRGCVHLTPLEGNLLFHLASNGGRLFSEDQLLDALYSFDWHPQGKIIDKMICLLRRKLTAATGGMDVIETVWGQGYRFVRDGYVPAVPRVRKRG